MNKSKMSGTDGGYGDDIHDLIDQVPVPNDDSITLSSYENSQITIARSMNQSKKTRDRGNRNEAFRGKHEYNKNDEEELSPYRNNAEKTLTIKSLNSSIQDEYEHSDERRRPLNSPNLNQTLSPTSSRNEDTSNFMSRNNRRNYEEDKEEFDNYQSIHYGDDTLDDNNSLNRRQRLELTEESCYNNNITNTTAFVDSAMRRHSYSDESYYEGEESEYEEEEEENSRDDYYRRTDQSNEEDRSLIDHTTTQYIRNKDITSGILFKQSQSDSTIDKNQITDENFYNHQNYLNSEDEEEEDEKEFNDGSEISGIDSLSQTHLSKLNSNKLNKNKRFNRRDHARMTGNFPKARDDSSQFNGTDSIGMQEGTQSIGFKSRNNKNEESLSLTPSNDSWGAITPRNPDFNKKTLKAKAERLNINEFDSKPINSHYIDDESKKIFKEESEGNENNIGQSNLYEDPDHVNSKTIERNSRNKKEIKSKKRQKDRNKNNSLIKAAGNLPRDSELENALSHLDNSNNHISLKDSNCMERGFNDAEEI